MNPMMLMQIKEKIDAFRREHPKVIRVISGLG